MSLHRRSLQRKTLLIEVSGRRSVANAMRKTSLRHQRPSLKMKSHLPSAATGRKRKVEEMLRRSQRRRLRHQSPAGKHEKMMNHQVTGRKRRVEEKEKEAREDDEPPSD